MGTMNEKFSDWWKAYIKSDTCKLTRTAWSYNEVGIIKEAMEDAFLHRQEEKKQNANTTTKDRQA